MIVMQHKFFGTDQLLNFARKCFGIQALTEARNQSMFCLYILRSVGFVGECFQDVLSQKVLGQILTGAFMKSERIYFKRKCIGVCEVAVFFYYNFPVFKALCPCKIQKIQFSTNFIFIAYLNQTLYQILQKKKLTISQNQEVLQWSEFSKGTKRISTALL